DFLDEVVVELRRLIAENEDLAAQLEDCRASRGQDADHTQAFAAGPSLDEQELEALRAERERVGDELEELNARVASARAEAEAAEAEAQQRIEAAKRSEEHTSELQSRENLV